MINYQQAIELIVQAAKSRNLGDELVLLEQCMGRLLSDSVTSPEDVPSFDNSAMDGFALRSGETRGASIDRPLQFKVVGALVAGDPPPEEISRESCAVEIMTGAPMPRGGFDAVVRVEDTQTILDSSGAMSAIRLSKPLTPKENVRFAGEDFKSGQVVLRAGTTLQPQHILALAALGITHLHVRRKPRVSIIATGKELVEHSVRDLEPGLIRNSTAPFLMSALTESGADPRFFGIIRDDPEEFTRTLRLALSENPDLVITTGAVSMGRHDFIRPTVERMGAQTIFHKVAIRPGKPLLFAQFQDESSKPNGPILFGVPGNPVSTAVGLRFFVLPFLRTLAGLPPEQGFTATLANSFPKPDGLRCFYKGRYSVQSGCLSVQALKGQASFMTSPLLEANCWVQFEEPGEGVAAGTRVQVFPMVPAMGLEEVLR